MKKNLENAVKNLKEVANNLAETGRNSVGHEVELLINSIESMGLLPPDFKTTDFEHSVGEEVEFPEAQSESALIERIIDESNLLPVWFLEKGANVQRSVARVVIHKPHTIPGVGTFPPGTGWATGFMVSPSLFLTNNHVIETFDFAKKIRIQFNFQLNSAGIENASDSYFVDTNDIFKTNAALDYSLVRLLPNQADNGAGNVLPGEKWGFINIQEDMTFRAEQNLNIIQHPSGRRKEVALQNNEVDRLFEHAVRYKTDTEPGSSGSPVFDNLWQLIALHHAGGDRDNATGKWVNNEGMRMDSIINDLRSELQGTPDENILGELGI